MRAHRKRDDPQATADVLSALGDVTRLSLVRRLTDEAPLSATQLGEGIPVTRQAVAKHLRVLEDAGVVTTEKRGRERLYSLDAARLELARRTLDDISAGWDRALSRLRALVEDDS